MLKMGDRAVAAFVSGDTHGYRFDPRITPLLRSRFDTKFLPS